MTLTNKRMRALLVLVLAGASMVAWSQKLREGVYIIRSAVDNEYVIDLNESSQEDGNNVQLWKGNESGAQRWYVKPLKGGGVLIANAADPEYRERGFHVMEVDQSHAQRGANVQIWQSSRSNGQIWYPERVGRGYYVLHSGLDSNYVLDLNDGKAHKGTNIQLWEYNGSKAQIWYFEPIRVPRHHSAPPRHRRSRR